MMSSSTRSGGLFSTLRRAVSPSSATLNLYSSRRASTRMSMFSFASSTMRTRLSDRSFTSDPLHTFECLLQSRLSIGESVTLNELLEFRPTRIAKQWPQRRLIRFDEIGRAGIEFGKERGEPSHPLPGSEATPPSP